MCHSMLCWHLCMQHGLHAHRTWFMFAFNCITLQEAGACVVPEAWDLMSALVANW
jgi:hypothetical protein